MREDARTPVESLPAEPFVAALAALNEDQTLGRYELLAPIGRGGMAVVWAARLRGTRGFSKLVALKTMLPVLSSDPRFEKMFLAEAEIASRIKHPNVGEILDLGEDHGVLYFVMDLVDGESLSNLADECERAGERIPYPVAARIVAQAARGLHAAHELRTEQGERYGLVHRDVSPQNILVGVDGQVKIVDFGVAKAAQRTDSVTTSGFIKGKVAYLAPEQVAGPDVDARADVFALGTVLYELTALRHPFRGGTDLATLIALSSDDPAPKPTREDYPEALWAIVARALEKNPLERTPTMRDLASALEALYAGEPEDAVATFVGRILERRRIERARDLREAARAADERAERRARTQQSTPIDTLEPMASPVAPPARTLGARALLVALAGLAGIGIGAAGVRASEGARAPAAAASIAASPPPPPPPAATTVGSTIAVAAEPPRPPALPTAKPTARAVAPKASAPPPVETKPAPTAAPPSASPVFHRPGF